MPPVSGTAIFEPMLILLLTVLSALAPPPAGVLPGEWGPRDPAGATAEGLTNALEAPPCCPTAAPAGEPSDPCAPGDSCPSSGGYCSCVSCCKRVTDAVPRVRPGGMSDGGLERALYEGSAGIDDGGAVWHPPRG